MLQQFVQVCYGVLDNCHLSACGWALSRRFLRFWSFEGHL